MEIKELNFVENLSNNDQETLVRDSVIGGDSYDYSYSYSYDLGSYFTHPIFDRIRDFDFGNITIEVIQPEIEIEIEFPMVRAIGSQVGIPNLPFG